VGYRYTKASYQAEDLYVVGLDGAGMRKISGTLDRDARNLFWATNGSGVYFTADDAGTSNIWFAPVNGAPRQVTKGTHMLTLAGVSRKGTAVGVRSSPSEPPDVVRVSLTGAADIQQLTRVNEDLLTGVTLGEVERIQYESTGGTKVDGWIVKPPAFDASKRYPLVMEIHGGPHGMYNVGFNYFFQAFASRGYVVLYTNPRGSTGYGTAFGNAIERAYPSVDYDDLMAGVDAILARGYVDERSMFVGGCSGGGVLSSWVIGHTNRFAAAAVRCPVINWLSFVGHTDIPNFTLNFFDAPFWEKPEQWLKQSPLMYVGNVKTPTLLMTGVLDMRTPMSQTEEYYTALKLRGVETKLLRFEDEYHGTTAKPSNFMRTVLYMESWYKQHRRDVPKTTSSGSDD
jgi:dipeptidyl aminopeptidase/acylaminoacyl peptidase